MWKLFQRGGFEVFIDENGNLRIVGKGVIPSILAFIYALRFPPGGARHNQPATRN